jgi:hypothetical protein
MRFTGIYNPEQLAVLSKVLDDHCASCCVERSSPDHEDAAYLVLPLYMKDTQTYEALKAALYAALASDER